MGTADATREFWALFSQRSDALARIESAEDPVYDEVLAKLQAIHEGLFFEFSTRGGKSELIITAEGERALFGLVDEIVAAAPEVSGWSYLALKPKVGLARSITWEGHVIEVSEVVFEPLEDEKSGAFGIRLLVPDLAEDKRDSAHNGLLRVLDHALGERRFADEIQFTEVDALDSDADDYIPLSALDRFIDWRNEKKKAKPGKPAKRTARKTARKAAKNKVQKVARKTPKKPPKKKAAKKASSKRRPPRAKKTARKRKR
jgi:hypothetical protein